MWDYKQEDWQALVDASLKKGIKAVLDKPLFDKVDIPAISQGSVSSPRQALVANSSPFLTIQNYQEMIDAGLTEWLDLPDVALRFGQLKNVLKYKEESILKNKALFVSQPYSFKLSSEERDFISQLSETSAYINFGWSPLSFGLTRGEILKRPFMGWEHIFTDEALKNDRCCWFYLSSAPYQWAGAESHVELAIMLSLGYAIVKELNHLGVPFEESKKKISFGLSLGTDVLIESSKIVALKLLWNKLAETMENKPQEKSVDVFTLPSLRYFSGRDPWNNVMRLTLMSFSSLIGGAQGFKCVPYDILNKENSPLAVRISTNIPLILQKEGYLGLNQNPMDGSPLFTQTIDQLCEHAWRYFQQIEKKGGLFEVIRSGWLQSEIKSSAKEKNEAVQEGSSHLVGTNKYISMSPQYGKDGASDIIRVQEMIDPKFLEMSEQDYMSVEPVLVKSLCYDWEALQVKSDRHVKKHGERPKILGLRLPGKIADKKAKWVESVLSLGGIQVSWKQPKEIEESSNLDGMAVLLPSNFEDEKTLQSLLKSKGVEKIWYQGKKQEDMDFDGYLHEGSNYYDFLCVVQRSIGGLDGSK